ncbi:MAG: hypothetical protein HY646_02430 [Acidobacteria bacterium]|nr:hypothetical protein [Acidobacteriota bacterium]
MQLDPPVTEKMHSFFAVLRLVAVTAGAVWGFFAPIDENSRSSFFLCLSITAVMGPGLYALIKKKPAAAGSVYRFALIVDLALVYWAVRVTGGLHSSLALGFSLLVALHAFHSGLRIGLAAALAASVLLLTLWDGTVWWGDLGMRLGFLHVLAAGAGLSSERERTFARDLLKTRKLAEQAQKMAVLGTLGAGIAHEVNNPTSSIIARVERVLLESNERQLSAETVKDLEIVRKHALRIGTTLQRLLAFARPEGFESRQFSLNDAIDETVPLVEGRLREKRVSLNLNLTRNVPLIVGDLMRIEEVIVNLLNNAADAAYWGSVIEVTTKVRDSWLELCVVDNGLGIEPEDLPHVFDPFFTTKPHGQGTGLGLYVAWQIVKDHGGTVALRSEPHRGTHATVKLPINAASSLEPKRHAF